MCFNGETSLAGLCLTIFHNSQLQCCWCLSFLVIVLLSSCFSGAGESQSFVVTTSAASKMPNLSLRIRRKSMPGKHCQTELWTGKHASAAVDHEVLTLICQLTPSTRPLFPPSHLILLMSAGRDVPADVRRGEEHHPRDRVHQRHHRRHLHPGGPENDHHVLHRDRQLHDVSTTSISQSPPPPSQMPCTYALLHIYHITVIRLQSIMRPVLLCVHPLV